MIYSLKGTKDMNEIKVIENDTKVVPYGIRGKASPMRKAYILKFIGRCIILLFCICLGFLCPREFDVLQDFTGRFSILHVLWFIWTVDMVLQLV